MCACVCTSVCACVCVLLCPYVCSCVHTFEDKQMSHFKFAENENLQTDGGTAPEIKLTCVERNFFCYSIF